MTTEQLRHRMPPILKALKERSLRGRTPVEGLRRTECAYHGWDTVHADAASWEPFAPGDAFGGLEAHHCFKGTVTLPEASAGKRVVCLVSTGASDIWNNNNPQFLAYVDGRLVCGLDVNHNEFDLAACAVPGESHELALYVYCNTPARDVFLRVETAERDDDVTGLYYDLRAPYEVCALLADDDTRAIGIMKHLNRALNLLDLQRRLAYGIPGAPRTRQSTSLAFFEELERRLAGQDVPCWCGEFYFEYHRGVFTTMARNKRYNRLAEFKNADAELFSALNLACGTAHAYPAEALAHNWELTLLNQFHDILPGSSIEKVYEDSMEQYEQVLASDAALIGDAQNALAALVRADGDGVLVFNQLGFARDALVRVPVEAPVAGVLADGRPLPFRWADGELCFVAAELPAKGWRHYRFAGCASAPVPFAQVSEDGRRITTPFYEAELDACGAFTRLYDIAARREVLKPGARGNVFQMFEDRPDNYDAWNLEQYYSEHMWELDGPAELSVEENSAVRCCVLVKRAFSRSAMEQRIVFYPHTRRIDFITHVDWHEEHALLKAAFPVDVYATRARYDIQFGSIERDTHRNTSWDAARFEVCAHKWADLSEAGYGVALLNDCKYGCDIHDGVMRLSLLRAPTHPNPNADRGAHTFTYALLPHEGDYRTGGVVREGYALNCPAYARPLAAQDGPLPESYSFVSVDAPGVVVEAVKRAEDGNGIIVRLYEAWGMRTRAVLSVPGSTRAVTPCTAMEDACGEAAVPENGGIPFQIRPFEFKTFRIELA